MSKSLNRTLDASQNELGAGVQLSKMDSTIRQLICPYDEQNVMKHNQLTVPHVSCRQEDWGLAAIALRVRVLHDSE